MERKARSDCVNASNPFHVCADYCSNRSSSSSHSKPKTGTGRRRRGGGGGEDQHRHVDPTCANASNPFHQCSDYCSNGPKTPPHANQRLVQVPKSAPNGGITNLEGRNVGKERNVNPQCVNASNPFHQCAEYCSHGNLGTTRPIKKNALGNLIVAESSKKSKERLLYRVDGKADPSCKNASNPFHVCAEYCSQRSNDAGRVEKGKSAIATGSKGSPKLAVKKRDVDPRCANAGNPFHECAEYCLQRIHRAT